MLNGFQLKPPFFQIVTKSYLFGDDVLALARAADAASKKYDVDVIFTSPLIELRRVAEATERIFVFGPHMDAIVPGRGVADILPESLAAAGAKGVVLNHSEKPMSLSVLSQTIRRADEVGLATIVFADTAAESAAVAQLGPNIIVTEPTGLIGTGQTSNMEYVLAAIRAVKAVNPAIYVLQGAGISCGEDVYRVIRAGAEATGASSGIAKAKDRAAMVDEMVGAVRRAWYERIAEAKPFDS
ncbi:MAG TPA: triose-phosphate isomerase [Clostridia bacterium]|nr:triose-phosphate isomerase [Clostridia bacterium]